MKRILGVVGSPRRNGNTHILVSRILDGAEAEGALSDILFLDVRIQECVRWLSYLLEGQPVQ